MAAVLITKSSSVSFERSDLGDGFSEKFLQELLFRQPDLVPFAQIDPSAGKFIPVCRELAMPKLGASVYLDIFGVTPSGRPVLIECKLWRNPQARREVIAQILEYAALLRQWRYADLIARLNARLGWRGANYLYEHAVLHGCPLSEAVFTDAVSRNLRNGDFQLIVAGDGIREDASAIAEHIGDKGARLSLVEFQRWRDADGNQLIVPFVPVRTEIIRQRVLIDNQGHSLRINDDEEISQGEIELVFDPEKASTRQANKEFWQSFIDRSRFDHPDQPPPRHGGNNWVKITLPPPARWLTAYRSKGRAGLFLVAEPGSDLIEHLVADAASLQQEFGLEPLRLHAQQNPNVPAISVDEPATTADQMSWLLDASNRLVNVLRPRLGNRRQHADLT